jgi:hypothetical protein
VTDPALEILVRHFTLAEVLAYVADRDAVRAISDWIAARNYDGPPTERDSRAQAIEKETVRCTAPECRAVALREGDPAHCGLCRIRALTAERDALKAALACVVAADDRCARYDVEHPRLADAHARDAVRSLNEAIYAGRELLR